MANPNCLILVPAFSNIEPETYEVLLEMRRRGYQVQTLKGCAEIGMARNTLATMAFERNFAETIWVDADIAFKPDDVERLRSHNLPICCGLYPKKDLSGFAAKFMRPGQYVFGDGGSLTELMHAGLGFVHVRREVYQMIAEKLLNGPVGGAYEFCPKVWPWFMPKIHAGEYLPDDAAFCQRARSCGFKIMADTSIRLGHIGRKMYTWDDFCLQEIGRFEYEIALPIPTNPTGAAV